jgi:hypothetical protein
VGGATTHRRTTPTTSPCQPTPYQPCGGPVAPFTDGRSCIADHADYDRIATNGCEAAPDVVDGSPIHGQVRANLVPAQDTDTYTVHVKDHFQLTCNGRLRLTLIAPPQVTERLEVLRGTDVIARAMSADRQPGSAEIGDPSCGSDDSETLSARVTPIGTDRTDRDYTLKVSGSY